MKMRAKYYLPIRIFVRWTVEVQAQQNDCLPGSVLVRRFHQIDRSAIHIKQKVFSLIRRAQRNDDLGAGAWEAPYAILSRGFFHGDEIVSFRLSEVDFRHPKCISVCEKLYFTTDAERSATTTANNLASPLYGSIRH